MAKTKYIDYKKQQQELFNRTEGYAADVRRIYQRAFTEIINLVKGTELEEGKPFSFSAYGYSEEVTPILRNMYSRIYQVIRGGVNKEWLKSNEHNDELVKAVFGEKSIEDNHFARYFQRNMEAMDAFLARKSAQGGLNLSQKVWNYTGQYKEELENTLDLSLGEGTPANRIATRVKQYLQDPDRYYKRFRVKIGEEEDGTPIYGRKWKRRIWNDAEQSYKWIDANPKDYHPGRGVYRSSARNAQRLARTETNIAYRSADYERWNQLDFVVGIEIKLSNNHTCNGLPFYDICDELKGIYPRDFKWTGWHPNCRCYSVPVLAPQDILDDMLDNILDGKDTGSIKSPNEVKKMPKEFQIWKDKNEERINKARDKGTLPYFIKDNERLIFPRTKQTPKEIAKARHDARTKEDIEKIRSKWYERKSILHYGESVARIMDGISDVNTRGLQDALKTGDQAVIMAEAGKLKALGKKIYSLDLLDDPMAVAKRFSMADAEAVQNAVKKKLDMIHTNDLSSQKHTLEFEINWVTDHKKYATWEAAANAYKKALDKINKTLEAQIKRKETTERARMIGEFLKSHPKQKKLKDLYDKIQDAVGKSDFDEAKKLTDEGYAHIQEYAKKKAKADQKKLKDIPDDLEEYIKQNYRTGFTVTSQAEYEHVMTMLGDCTKDPWRKATNIQREAFPSYTNSSSVSCRVLTNVGLGKPEVLADRLDSILDKIHTTEDLVLRSGQNYDVARYVFGDDFTNLLKNGDLDQLNSKFAGTVGVNKAYMSTSFNQRGGFAKQFEVHIYAPKGTSCINLNEVSAFGNCKGSGWDGESFSPVWRDNGETEIFLHRGYKWRFVKAEPGTGLGGTTRIYVQLLDRIK